VDDSTWEDAAVMLSLRIWTSLLLAVLWTLPCAARVYAQPVSGPAAARSDSVRIRIQNVELRSAVAILQQYLDIPVVLAGTATTMVSLETPVPVARTAVVSLLRGLLESNGFELVLDSSGTLYRARQRPAAPTPGLAGPVPRGQTTLELFVIPLKHARAADVATTIGALYGRGGDWSGGSQSQSGLLADELRNNQIPPAGGPGLPVPRVAGGQGGSLSGELVVVPDARANSLLVRSTAADIVLIRSIVEQLDVRPLQAMIEVLIVEVRRDRGLRYGIDAALGNTTVGKNGASVNGSLAGPGLGDFVLRVMGAGGLELDAVLRAGAERGDVRVISRPVVFTTNNEEAEIVVGSQRPFVQVSRTLPTDAGSRDQIVQFKDVGTKLRVRPTISTDGSVQLEVTQEVSGATSETAFNAPVISTRSIRTQLLIEDGKTVALGGLSDQQREHQQVGIPLLSSIPWLGGLFGSVSRRGDETELFIFITPRVIRSSEDAERLSKELRERSLPGVDK
jgi:general secretion pathway protein D